MRGIQCLLMQQMPVRPGDQLTLRITVHKVKPSRSKPDRGVLFSFCEMLNQDNEVVLTMMALNLIRYRELS
jgi:acyl dehydratase